MSPIIPIIDLSNDTPAQQASSIKTALSSVGFFEVRNSSVTPEDVDTMFKQVYILAIYVLPADGRAPLVYGRLSPSYGREGEVSS
jgi:isopenicillin N synthase-like dioxygenase